MLCFLYVAKCAVQVVLHIYTECCRCLSLLLVSLSTLLVTLPLMLLLLLLLRLFYLLQIINRRRDLVIREQTVADLRHWRIHVTKQKSRHTVIIGGAARA
jgi:hypothetical protein